VFADERPLSHRCEQAEANGPDAALHCLAIARQELAVSPASARLMISRFRTVWQLDEA
jgi:hypothetical protein